MPKQYVKDAELARLRTTVHRLLTVMETVENMLRHPSDPFVMVNAANYLNQERNKHWEIKEEQVEV